MSTSQEFSEIETLQGEVFLLKHLLSHIHELSAEVVNTVERGNAILEAINLTIHYEKPTEAIE